MSSKRPGTVDYSKWDNFECSDDSESEEEEPSYRPAPNRHHFEEEEDDDSDEYEESVEEDDCSDYESESDESSEDSSPPVPPPAPAPTLAVLQRAWNSDTSGITRPCANCFSPNSHFSCSRCKLVRYCNTACQVRYHPVHKLECIDARKHASYWGMFKKRAEGEAAVDDTVVLLARRSSKRRRALQRAAAAAAVERARRARMARGGADAKGGGKGKGAEEREEMCSICQCEFTVAGDGGVAFCCPTSHYMCNECCGTWVNSVMEDLTTSYPPKCPLCKALINNETVERQLTSAQQNTFRAHAARTALKLGEELIECKECGLFEVVSDDPVLWWCPHCECGTCRVCNKDIFTWKDGYNIFQSPHDNCVRLREPKALIEQAIEEGSKMRCPSCKLAGRKDDACTHMTCTKCSTSWCYVCGLDVLKCDKAPGAADDIYLHNRDWETNDKRCPMYLTQILEVDLNWLGEDWENNARDEDFQDDEKCLDYLHRFRTIQLLQEVLAKIGKKQFLGAFVSFDSIKNCGYTYNEVISTCTETLIDRSAFIQDRADVEENQADDGNDGVDEAFANVLQRQVELAVGAGGGGEEEEEVDPEELEERLVAQAIDRSTATLQEDDELRQAMARSETATDDQANH